MRFSLSQDERPISRRTFVATGTTMAAGLAIGKALGEPVWREQPLLDLSEIRRNVLAYCESLQMAGAPYGSFRGKPGGEFDFYASADIAIIRTIMGEDLRRTLSEDQRRAWIKTLNATQNPADGSYPTFRHHSKLHANGTAVGALGAMGGKMAHPNRLYEPFDTADKVVPWLETAIDWREQWTASHLFWGGMHCYSLSAHCTPRWRESVFAWLDDHLDPNTGWWRKGVPHADRNQALGGSVHILPIYQHHRRRFPYPERLIDSILALQLPAGHWHEKFNASYLELDALYGLRFAMAQAPTYRSIDIANAVSRLAVLAVSRLDWLLDRSRNDHVHVLLAIVGMLGLLQQHQPKQFVDGQIWTDIFSDPALYHTNSVEVNSEVRDD